MYGRRRKKTRSRGRSRGRRRSKRYGTYRVSRGGIRM